MKITIELPSGTSLSNKIKANTKYWVDAYLDRIKGLPENAESNRSLIRRDIETEIKQSIHGLVDKAYIVFHPDDNTSITVKPII